jgi:HEAT repeat protein
MLSRFGKAALAAGFAMLLVSCTGDKYVPERRSVQELLEDLKHTGDYKVREAAAKRLGALREKAAVAFLVAALDDSIHEVRIAVIESLGQIGDAAAVWPLCGILEQSWQSRPIRAAAIKALGQIRDERAAGALISSRQDTRWEAAQALLSLGESAIAPLIAGLRAAETRLLATDVLATLGEPAVNPLISVLEHDNNSSTRLAAARALSEIPDPRAAAALNRALTPGDAELAAAAYRFLIREGRPGSEPLLIRALEQYGRVSMAEEFAGAGNPVLKSAAAAWARKRELMLATPSDRTGSLRWAQAPAPLVPLALFHFDGSLASTSGASPVEAKKASFVPGKWGSALAVNSEGILSYALEGNLDFRRGAIEMWVAPRFDGSDPIYTRHNHAFLLYHSPDGDQFLVSEGTWLGVYAGSVIRGKLHGPGGGNISGWKAGIWHHIAFTYSAGGDQRLYVDGVPVSERSGIMPSPGAGGRFTIGGDPYGNSSAFLIDELRISQDEKSLEEIRYAVGRKRPFAEREYFRPLDSGI